MPQEPVPWVHFSIAFSIARLAYQEMGEGRVQSSGQGGLMTVHQTRPAPRAHNVIQTDLREFGAGQGLRTTPKRPPLPLPV